MKKSLATILSITLASASFIVLPSPSFAVTKDVFCQMTAKHEANKVVKDGSSRRKLIRKKAKVYETVYAECMA